MYNVLFTSCLALIFLVAHYLSTIVLLSFEVH